MSKLYVPDGAWLVCSNGMKKQQIKVTSQSKVQIAGGKLKATIGDRPGGNFICGKMMLAGAIIGAVVGIALVAGSILTGGALAVAACAAIGAGVGLGASLIPSICGMLLNNWFPYDKNVLTQMQPPLIENSTIPCKLGGVVMILYSEKAADEFTDLTIGQTAINVVGTVALSYLLYPALAALGTTALTAKTTITAFGWAAGGNYLMGTAVSFGTAYGVGWGIDKAKNDLIYKNIPVGGGNTVHDYVTGFETNPADIVRNGTIPVSPDDGKSAYEHLNDAGGAMGVANETVGDRTSVYSQTETNTSVRLDDIEEHGPTVYGENGRIDGAIEGRNPTQLDPNRTVIDEDFGGRYQEVETTNTTTNQQYDKIDLSRNGTSNLIRESGINALKDNFSKPNLSTNSGPSGGGFYLSLLEDVYKGISNIILKGQAEDLVDAMKNEEAVARAKISVIAGND